MARQLSESIWLPRTGRHSAGFPGGIGPDRHAAEVTIGSQNISGVMESSDTRFLADWDQAGMALSVTAIAPKQANWPVIKAILKSLAINPDQRAPQTRQRVGLELVEQFAREKKPPNFKVVFTPSDAQSAGTSKSD